MRAQSISFLFNGIFFIDYLFGYEYCFGKTKLCFLALSREQKIKSIFKRYHRLRLIFTNESIGKKLNLLLIKIKCSEGRLTLPDRISKKFYTSCFVNL